MTIVEALNRLRKDIQLWASNNFRLKLDKNLGTENANRVLTTDETGAIQTSSISSISPDITSVISEDATNQQVAGAKAVYDYAVPLVLSGTPDTLFLVEGETGSIVSSDGKFVKVSNIVPKTSDFINGDSKVGLNGQDPSEILYITYQDGNYFDNEQYIAISGSTNQQIYETSFPEPGIYFNIEKKVTSFYIPQYTGFAIKVIDPAYCLNLMPKILTEEFYGPELPPPGIPGRFFLKKVTK